MSVSSAPRMRRMSEPRTMLVECLLARGQVAQHSLELTTTHQAGESCR